MQDYAAREFSILRETIRSRGGLRPLVLLAGVSVWATVLVAVLVWLPNPIASTVPLVVLLATLEALRTLHLGVERIGRYIQVFFEEDSATGAPSGAPAWEHIAMQLGPSLPGAGGHPYFLAVLLMATVVNYLAVLFPGPLAIELATLAVPHLAFVTWLIHCDRGMRKQRATELARFRELRARAADDAGRASRLSERERDQ
jgi:Flp pilus assembly protein TadB